MSARPSAPNSAAAKPDGLHMALRGLVRLLARAAARDCLRESDPGEDRSATRPSSSSSMSKGDKP